MGFAHGRWCLQCLYLTHRVTMPQTVIFFFGGGGGVLNILAISAHAKQIKTQKYENSCLVAYENTARNQGHQTKRLQEVTEK